jgi:D-alanyl-D-alanine carboxypeptidase
MLAGTAPTGAVSAEAKPKSAVLVVDANSGRVLYQSAADEPRHPASLAKMMTIYIAFELIEQGRLSYQTKVKFSASAVAAAPSKLDLEEGEEIALLDAIKILITKSANDVAVALAEHIAGSEERFARLMTRKAHQLGMTATTFRNASGLPDEAQVTTARDMVTLALRLQDDFPRHYPLFATHTATYKDETFRNHNTLLSHYEGTDGLKTGYTRASGFNLVASVRRGKKHVVGAIFGGASAASRNAAMRTFLNIGLVKASSEKTRQPTAALVAQAAAPKPQRVPRPPVKVVAAAPPPSVEPVAAPAPPTTPPIEIARVRPVPVGPRAADTAADEPAVRASPEPAGAMAPWASPSLASPPNPPAAPADRPAFFFDPTLPRGAAPSTLAEQAANLDRGGPALPAPATTSALPPPPPSPPVRVQPPARTAAAPASSASRGAFQIQIGAYQNEAEAARQLSAVRERAGALLAKSAPVTLQVQQGQKLFYRARYSGFDAGTAAQACNEIKKLKIDCLVVKAE